MSEVRAGARAGSAPLTVLLLPGVVTPRRRLRGWRETLAAALPQARVRVPARCFYWLWGAGGQRRTLAAAQAELHAAPGPVWMLAHSFGGLIARAALARCPDAPVVLLTTMASPHDYPWFGVARQGRALGAAGRCPVPVHTYGGAWDLTVPHPWTRLPGAVHRNFRCGHLGFLFDRRVREAVVRDALALLGATQPPVTTSYAPSSAFVTK